MATTAPPACTAPQAVEDARRTTSTCRMVLAAAMFLREHTAHQSGDQADEEIAAAVPLLENQLAAAAGFLELAAAAPYPADSRAAALAWTFADRAESTAIEMSTAMQLVAKKLADTRGSLPAHPDPRVSTLLTRVLASGSYIDHDEAR